LNVVPDPIHSQDNGQDGRVIGMRTFGASAPLKELQKKFGFEPDRVVEVVRELLEKNVQRST